MTVKCESCGNELSKQVKFCTRCGVAVPQAQSYETNVYATEPLSADEETAAVQNTEALVPDMEEFPPSSVSTGKVSHPTAGRLKTPMTVSGVSTSPIRSKSSKTPATIIALLLIAVVAAVGIYFATGNPSTTTEAVASPTPISVPTPGETPQPISSATPGVQVSPQETAGKAVDTTAEKTKTPAGLSANPTGNNDASGLLTAADHIKLGVNAVNPSAALAEYQQALKLDPANTDVHYLMGLAYQQLGQLDQALDAYRQCASGKYASVAAQHVKKLEKDLKKKD